MIKTIGNSTILLLILTTVFFVLWDAREIQKRCWPKIINKTMSNENLLRYYFSLNDEIERQEKQSDPQFGIGIGSFGNGAGGGADVKHGRIGIYCR